jgi:ACS family tartrate transporter-like MFS transporter
MFRQYWNMGSALMKTASAIERQTMGKVYLRLLPFCFVLYFICYLDRVNIGFAALTMNKDLGLSSYIFGLGAGAFFWGYFILEVPSNLILERVGASRWIARIMIGWGLVSGAFAFTQGPISFFILRFTLGLAEAGFFPGMILYFTYWFPPLHRARIVAGFMAAIPVSIGLGAPVSTAFLELDGVLGLAGWKWLFLGEAAPALIFGLACWFYLPDRPAQAKWLSADQKAWLDSEMQKEHKTVTQHRSFSVLQSMGNPRVLALGAIHFGQAGVSVGLAVFVAQIIKQMGLTNMQTGFTTMIPYAAGTIGMVIWGHYSDKKNERRWNLTASCLTMGVGCALAGYCGVSYWSVVGLSLATIGLYASNAHLFPLPSVFLSGPALASGIAWVNSVGILGGSVSPPIVGYLRDLSGNFTTGLYALALFGVGAAVISALTVRETPADETEWTTAEINALKIPALVLGFAGSLGLVALAIYGYATGSIFFAGGLLPTICVVIPVVAVVGAALVMIAPLAASILMLVSAIGLVALLGFGLLTGGPVILLGVGGVLVFVAGANQPSSGARVAAQAGN